MVVYLKHEKLSQKKLNNNKIIIHKRKDGSLSNNKTSTQKLINHACEIIPDGHIDS